MRRYCKIAPIGSCAGSGSVVRYGREPWTESVHVLLAYLAERGFTEAPRPLALTEEYEDLSFIDGASGDDACRLVASDSAVAAVAQLLRRYHDAVADWSPGWHRTGTTGRSAPAVPTNSSATATRVPGTSSGATAISWA